MTTKETVELLYKLGYAPIPEIATIAACLAGLIHMEDWEALGKLSETCKTISLAQLERFGAVPNQSRRSRI